MREIYWGVYQSVVYKMSCYSRARQIAMATMFWARLLCTALSLGSVLAWSISRSAPLIWACLVAITQCTQVFLDQIPWPKQIAAIDYMMPDLNGLLSEMEANWLSIESGAVSDPTDIMRLAVECDREFRKIEDKYTAGVWFNWDGRASKAGARDADAYFSNRFFLVKGGESAAAA